MYFNITFIGAGNVAWHLAQAFNAAGHNIVQIYSRNLTNAQSLAIKTGANATDKLNEISSEADIFIYCLKDDILKTITENIHIEDKIHIHTSGSSDIKLFSTTKKNYGCIYPLQTFTKEKKQNSESIPFFIEGNNLETEKKIESLALTISHTVYRLTSEERKYLHIAAVFACNFTNLMYIKAADILKEKNIPFCVMRNLITESVEKALLIGPEKAQTGPAARNDNSIMEEHIRMLGNEKKWQKLYMELSDMIKNLQHEL